MKKRLVPAEELEPVFSPGEYTFQPTGKSDPLAYKVFLCRVQDGKPTNPPSEMFVFEALKLVSKGTTRFSEPELGIWPRDQAPRGQQFTTRVKVSTEEGEYWVDGKPFALAILHLALSLRERGLTIGSVRYFFYDEARYLLEGRADWGRAFSFFLVSDAEEIVMDSVTFRNDEDFSPEAFKARESSPQATAFARYWYRRFYTKTRMGEFMMLRPDQPSLFYFDGTRLDQGALLEAQVTLLARIKRLLFWLVVAVVGIGLVLLLRR